MSSHIAIKEFIVKWNNLFPIDYWFRKKYNLAFNSEAHRKCNIIDMKIEYEEAILMEKAFREEEEKQENYRDYKATGKYLKTNKKFKKYSDSELDDAFDNIDLDTINKRNSELKNNQSNQILDTTK